jgi:hypothetical protein
MQAALAREQELFAQQRATELAKATTAKGMEICLPFCPSCSPRGV